MENRRQKEILGLTLRVNLLKKLCDHPVINILTIQPIHVSFIYNPWLGTVDCMAHTCHMPKPQGHFILFNHWVHLDDNQAQRLLTRGTTTSSISYCGISPLKIVLGCAYRIHTRGCYTAHIQCMQYGITSTVWHQLKGQDNFPRTFFLFQALIVSPLGQQLNQKLFHQIVP